MGSGTAKICIGAKGVTVGNGGLYTIPIAAYTILPKSILLVSYPADITMVSAILLLDGVVQSIPNYVLHYTYDAREKDTEIRWNINTETKEFYGSFIPGTAGGTYTFGGIIYIEFY